MALLAEVKRKTKFGLDPRNTNWSNDESKFGQRLMEKMGWEKGKGLGAKGDGMTEHIKATYKSDTRGLGCSHKDADAWIAHQDDFNELLKSLNSGTGGQEEIKEEKKNNSDGQKRYYGRFSRGRVQTLRSTEDLDCIFGKRKNKSGSNSPAVQSAGNSDNDEEESRHGLTTVTSTSSVQEYFAKKMAEMKARKNANSGQTGLSESAADNKDNSSTFDDREKKEDRVPSVYGAVSFSYDDEADDNNENEKEACQKLKCRGWYEDWSKNEDNSDKTYETQVGKNSKKKKKKKKNDEDDGDKNCQVFEDNVCNEGKKSKRRKKDKVAEGMEDLGEVGETENVTFSVGDDSLISKKEKKKKDKSHRNRTSDVLGDTETHATECNEESVLSKRKKSKKKKKAENEEDSEVCNVNCETKSKKSEKRKRKLEEFNNEDNDTGKESKSDVIDLEQEDAPGKKKEKKRKREEEVTEDTLVYSENDKKKKSKQKDLKTVTEATTTSSTSHDSNSIADEDTKKPDADSKKSRKKKKKDKKADDFLFPGSNISAIRGYAQSTYKKGQ